MSEIRHQGRILEAIDQLRRRKARPDVDRICNFLSRRFSVDSQDTRADLQKLVDAEIVIRVEYKGNISYRNAAKWTRYAMYKKQDISNQPNSEAITSLILTTIGELIVKEPDYLEMGIPPDDLERGLQEKDPTKFTKKSLGVILQKEVFYGILERFSNGNYTVSQRSSPDSSATMSNNDISVMKFGNSTPNDINGKLKKINEIKVQTPENTPPANTTGFRVGIRTKKAKKVFDPSDNNIPARKRGRPLGSTNKPKPEHLLKNVMEPGPSCCICHHHNKRGIYEKLVSCKDCTHRAHPSCIEATDIHSKVTNWLCQNCKTCCSCFEPAESQSMVVCSGCDDYYHVACSNASKADVQSNTHWLCAKCTLENKYSLSSTFSSTRTSPNTNEVNGNDIFFSSSNSFIKEEVKEEEDLIDHSIPDVSSWSSEDVFQYFCSQGFLDGANALKEDYSQEISVPPSEAVLHLIIARITQVNDSFNRIKLEDGFRTRRLIGIDGSSLLLMKRNDVLTGLDLKLGQALKLYAQIKKLQIRRNDLYLLWA